MTGLGLVEELRGDIVEARHTIHAALARADGTLVAAAGDPALVTYLRSAAKPFQALPAVAAGAVDAFGLEPAHLAVGCASHGGTPRHSATVAELLRRAGVPVGAVRVRYLHPPLDEAAARALRLAGRALSPLEHNCSGNHALMLAHGALAGLPLDGYLERHGPLQAGATEAVAAAFGAAPALADDRCGMTAYALDLRTMAAGYARLATGALPGPWREPGRRVLAAMRAEPELVAGLGRLDTLALEVEGVVAKGGARGVFCCGSAETGLGGALKVEGGDGMAATLAGAVLVEAVAGRSLPHLAALRERRDYRVRLELG